MRKFLGSTFVLTVILAIAALSMAQQRQASSGAGPAFTEGVALFDSLKSITGSMGKSGSAWFVPAKMGLFKIVGAGNDTSAPIPAINAILDGFVVSHRGTGTASVGSTTVGIWLQGATSPTPFKGTQWFDITLLDTFSQVTDTTTVAYRLSKGLIRGAAGDTIGRGVPYWRIRFNGAGTSADSSWLTFSPVIRYPHTQVK